MPMGIKARAALSAWSPGDGKKQGTYTPLVDNRSLKETFFLIGKLERTHRGLACPLRVLPRGQLSLDMCLYS